MMIRRLNERADTIIEVMLAMGLLTAFLFISWGITNRSTQMSTNARRRVEMVNAMKEQAEVLKALHAQGAPMGALIEDSLPMPDSEDSQVCEGGNMSRAFHYKSFLEDDVEEIDRAAGVYQLPDENNTVWVEYKVDPLSDPDNPPEYFDFYVRACWQTVGSIQNTDNSQFIVRLNSNE